MKQNKKKNLTLSKVAIAKINLYQIEAIKGGTLPASDFQNSTGLHSQCENEMCR